MPSILPRPQRGRNSLFREQRDGTPYEGPGLGVQRQSLSLDAGREAQDPFCWTTRPPSERCPAVPAGAFQQQLPGPQQSPSGITVTELRSPLVSCGDRTDDPSQGNGGASSRGINSRGGTGIISSA